MLKKGWEFIKGNVAAIITAVTAMLTVVYAALRLCLYVYWKGYFTRLSIDENMMNTNFDKSIFAVVFISLILFVVLFFMAWVCDIINDIVKKEKERQIKGIVRFFYWIKAFAIGFLLSMIILAIINAPLVMLLVSVARINFTIDNTIYLFILLYFMEMLFIFTQRTKKHQEKKEKRIEGEIAIKIICILASVLIILSTLFYEGSYAIDSKTRVQLTENEEYMISYCNGEQYVLHKVKYKGEEMIVYRGEQKIVGIEDCEYSIKQVEKIIIKD